MKEWIINVHEKGHFVPNNPELYGGDFAYHRVGKGEFTLYGMEKTVSKHINVDGNCEEDTGVRNDSLARCLYRYVGRRVGCQMPWVKDDMDQECISMEHYRKFLEHYGDLNQLDGDSMARKTECLPRCERSKFKLRPLANSGSDDHIFDSIPKELRAFAAQFMYLNSRYTEEVFYYTYDFESLIADFGGYMGLLLGHSILTLYDHLIDLVRSVKLTFLNYLKYRLEGNLI